MRAFPPDESVAELMEINGEYVLRVEPVGAGTRVIVAMVRRREYLERANALIEDLARAQGGLLAIEPIIDNVRFVVADAALVGLLEALRAVRFGDRDADALTEDGARRAVLARITAAGGDVAWEDACSADLEAAEFPLGYRGRDAIAALIAGGALVAVRALGQAPRLQLTAAGAEARMTAFEPPRELLGSRSVEDLRALTPDQQRELRGLATREPAAAEERLRFWLRRWQSRLNRRYVDEVLLGGADHARWVAEHHSLTTRSEEVIGDLGRAFTDEEAATVASIADLAPAHRALVAHLCREDGPIVASLYLQCVVRDWRTEVLRDYVEYVAEGRLRHDDWVKRHLPRFAPARRGAP